jgi:hypothetical protein
MRILPRFRGAGVGASVAIALIVAACSSAAAPLAASPPAAAASAGAAATQALGPLGTPVLADPFISAGIATTVDSNAHAVDPSTYRTTIPGAQFKNVYVVFALKPDAVGKVTMVMTLNDVDVLEKPLSIDYGTINSWGDFKVDFPDAGIPVGTYKAVMTFEPTGAQVVESFTVT